MHLKSCEKKCSFSMTLVIILQNYLHAMDIGYWILFIYLFSVIVLCSYECYFEMLAFHFLELIQYFVWFEINSFGIRKNPIKETNINSKFIDNKFVACCKWIFFGNVISVEEQVSERHSNILSRIFFSSIHRISLGEINTCICVPCMTVDKKELSSLRRFCWMCEYHWF